MDCHDKTDEMNCVCGDRLLETAAHKICDGKIDCDDFTDEICSRY